MTPEPRPRGVAEPRPGGVVRFDLELPFDLKSQNARGGWRDHHRETKYFEGQLRLFFNAYRLKPSPVPGMQRLTLTRILGKGQRLFDHANTYGGSAKGLQDALKRLGWFADDSPRYLETVVMQDASRRTHPACRAVLEILGSEVRLE